jgi:hypothetical protein
MQGRVFLRSEKYYPSRNWLLLMLVLPLGCSQREPDIQSLSTNTTTPQAQISAQAKGDDIDVRVTLVNRGSSPFALLKWNLPENGRLDGALFDVSRDGMRIEYRGIEVKRSVSDADYVRLKHGHEYTTSIWLAQGYDVSQRGKYKIQYHAWNPIPYGTKVLSFGSNVIEVDKQ